MSFDLKYTLGALPVMERGMGIHLSGDPKNTSFVYCCGSTVFIRELANTKNCWTFNDNQHPVTVAKYAPSGFYIAAGDEKGMVKIFDTTTAAHPVKIELPISSGKLRDIAWTEDSKRVCVVGSSTSGNYGRVFLWDSGSSVGEISGSSDSLLTCDIRPTRPYRMITAGEDSQAIWFEGPPFKFKRTLDGGHTRFVTSARFSPSGEFVVIVSQDKKGSVFDGTTGEKIASLEGGHKGGIYALSWSPDSTHFVTASADKTLVVWAAGTWKPTATLTGIDSGGMDLDDQQLAVLWLGKSIISAGLNGFFHVFDPASPAKPLRTIHGHNKIITAMATDGKFAYTAGFDGLVVRWDLASGDTAIIRGVGHSNQINRMALSASGLLYSGSMDDSIRVCPVAEMDWQHAASIGANGPVRDVAAVGELAVAVTSKTLYLIKGRELKGKVDLGFDGVSCAISPDGKHVVVGGGDTHVHVYTVDAGGASVKEVAKLEKHRGPVGSLAFSPNGAYLASADTEKRLIVLWCAKEWKSLFGRWEFHTGNVRTLAWAPDSVHLASGAIDESVIIWTAAPEDKRLKKITIPRANRGGVNTVAWLDGNTVATVGADCTLRAWGVTFF